MASLQQWFFHTFPAESVALTVLLLCVAAALGLALGGLSFRGLSLGIGGVLFAGLAVGHWLSTRHPAEHALNAEVMEFVRDFGLILFVYTIGVQVGPGFLASLRRQGLPLNLLAAAIVLMSVGVTIAVCKLGGVEMRHAVGLFAGGTTNTPSLAAAAQALRDKGISTPETVSAYAIAYPFGIVGIILTMIAVRLAFRIRLDKEQAALEAQQPQTQPLDRMTLQVTNPNLDGKPLSRVPGLRGGNVVVSRILRGESVTLANADTVLHAGDVLLAVGPRQELEDLRITVGSESNVDFAAMPSPIATRRLLVTRSDALGKTVHELDLAHRLGVRVTRVRRGEVEFTPSKSVHLQFGDRLTVVGDEAAIKQAAAEVGDSPKHLDHPQVLPIFVGIALGVFVGSLPFTFPGVPAPVKLGLAGGPLIVAIILSRLGHFGPMVWFLPSSANFALREVGIVLFLAAVGVKSGGAFFHTLAEGPGLQWLLYGALITAIPLAIAAVIGRAIMKLNYMTLCGLLAGSMTDPPALQFAGNVTHSEAPGVAYAAVYPLVMLMRVIAAQALVLAFV